MDKLAKIFHSSARVKIMRLFLFNDNLAFDAVDIAKRSKVPVATVRKELKVLSDTGFIKKKQFTKEVTIKPKSTVKKKPTKKGGKKEAAKKKTKKKAPIVKVKKVNGWILSDTFPLIKPLRSLLIDSELVKKQELPKRFATAGKIKMLVLSGIFVKDDERNVDIVVVGDKLDMKKLNRTLQSIEAEVGKELRYSVFTPKEFQYRIEMYDQHLLDIFEYPHDRIVDKLGIV